MSKLYIPRGVDKNKYWIEGYGTKEAVQSLIVFGMLLPIWIILGFSYSFGYLFSITGMGFAMFSISVTIKKDEISVYDSIKQVIKYFKGQKIYDYKGGYELERKIEK